MTLPYSFQVGATHNEMQDVDVVYYDGTLVVPEDMSGVQILDNPISPEAGSEHDETDKESRKRKNVITGRNPGKCGWQTFFLNRNKSKEHVAQSTSKGENAK